MGSEPLGGGAPAGGGLASKTYSVVSSVTSTVYESGKSMGQAIGVVQQPRKGALNDPAFMNQQQYGSTYNPPSGMQSMSSEQFQHQSSSQSYNSYQGSTSGPWGKGSTPTSNSKPTESTKKPSTKKHIDINTRKKRPVESESSSSEFEEEISQPKTRDSKKGKRSTGKKPKEQEEAKKPEPEPVADLLDMGGSGSTSAVGEKKDFAFDFMSGGGNQSNQ